MSTNRFSWDALYSRQASAERPPAERDSVPPLLADAWGVPEACLTDPVVSSSIAFMLAAYRGAAAERILEIGAGDGSTLAALLALRPGARGVGLDVSEVAVGHANRMSRERGLASRAVYLRADIHQAWPQISGQFDFIYSHKAMQFGTCSQFRCLISEKVAPLLAPGGLFVFKARSDSRDIPASYAAVAGEHATYQSNEPHEQGMVYHHLSRQEVAWAAGKLGARIEFLREDTLVRTYEAGTPRRAWWEVVLRAAGPETQEPVSFREGGSR